MLSANDRRFLRSLRIEAWEDSKPSDQLEAIVRELRRLSQPLPRYVNTQFIVPKDGPWPAVTFTVVGVTDDGMTVRLTEEAKQPILKIAWWRIREKPKST